ncbi:MAG: hypothetical protein U1A23_03830 [Candidatus Sungbacteria bacterium]|nr:hypothetical protein [Candidatus Sungbacteria bacterium]
MQKKFLRTSVLTLVLGVSLMNEIHAMDTSKEFEVYKKAAKLEQDWLLAEITTCEKKYQPTRAKINPGCYVGGWKSSTTGISHHRRPRITPKTTWGFGTKIQEEEKCDGCKKTLRMWTKSRTAADNYQYHNRPGELSPMPPPLLQSRKWRSWMPNVAVTLTETEGEHKPTHDAPSPLFASGHSPSYSSSTPYNTLPAPSHLLHPPGKPHYAPSPLFASRPDEQQTDNWDTCESWSSGESDQEAKIDWTSPMTEYPEKPETQCDDENYRPFGSGWAADYWGDFAENERTRDDVADANQEYTPGTEKETEQAPAAEAAPEQYPMLHFRI